MARCGTALVASSCRPRYTPTFLGNCDVCRLPFAPKLQLDFRQAEYEAVVRPTDGASQVNLQGDDNHANSGPDIEPPSRRVYFRECYRRSNGSKIAALSSCATAGKIG